MSEEILIDQIAGNLSLEKWQVKNTVELIDSGNTIPFIARYRKEKTGELDEVKIAAVAEQAKYLRELYARQAEVLRLIGEQGKLTAALEKAIKATTEKQQLEDLYRPFRPKRKTRASAAREKGLEPLARLIASGSGDLEQALAQAEQLAEVGSREEAIQGALDIIAEEIADDPQNREQIRKISWKKGSLEVTARDAGEHSVYEQYYDYREPVRQIPPHRVLAINRGEKEEFLRVKIEAPLDEINSFLYERHVQASSPLAPYQVAAAEDAYQRLLAPAVERDLRRRLTEEAEEKALEVFGENLHHLLLQPPLRNKIILAIDPAYRTGCKLAVVSATGKLLETGVIYPTPPQSDIQRASKIIKELVSKYSVDAICIGNGTASRETEAFIAGLLPELDRSVAYTIVNEAGASVYSASSLAREEFGNLDVAQRSAISLARRLQDPLAELVKIDPKSLGVGQYQHDINPKKLEQKLSFVVETAVNRVGVDLNTASVPLLSHVSGLSARIAKNIVAFREQSGTFQNRRQLAKIPGLGPKTYEQCVGFLRIPGGENPLDNTPIHPESYSFAQKLLNHLGMDLKSLGSKKLRGSIQKVDMEKLSQELKAGLPTLKDIAEAIIRPGRDPREELPPPIFRTDVLRMEDLRPGMQLRGTIRNVVDFGVFVDIGVKHDGLVHISQLADKFVRHPSEEVAVGDVVEVKVLEVDLNKERISLTMKES